MNNRMEPISLNNAQFGEIKADFDIMLQLMLNTMVDKKASDGKITLALAVNLEEITVNGRSSIKPTFTSKTTTKVEIKNETGCEAGGDGYEISMDGRTIFLGHVDDGQESIFEGDGDD